MEPHPRRTRAYPFHLRISMGFTSQNLTALVLLPLLHRSKRHIRIDRLVCRGSHMALAHEEAGEPQPKEDDNTASAEPSSTHSTRLAGRSNRAVSPLLPDGRAVPAWMDARSCIRHGSWKAGCITKGACPVWKAGIGNRRQQCRTALVLDLTLHSAGQGLHLPGGDHGLALAGSAGLADIEHAARRLLRRCPGRGAAAVRQTGDLQYRPG